MIYAPTLQPMTEAPHDGTHILALQQHETEMCKPTWQEWKEIWWDKHGFELVEGMKFHWMSGEEDDRGYHGELSFVGWIPCPLKPGSR